MAARPIPLIFRHVDGHERYKSSGGSIRIESHDSHLFALDAFYLIGDQPGVVIRGLNCAIDIAPMSSNLVVIKGRR